MGKLIIPAAKFYAPSFGKKQLSKSKLSYHILSRKINRDIYNIQYIYITHIITYKLSCQTLSKLIPTKGTNDFTWSSVISKKTTRHQHQSPLTAPGIAVPGFGSAPAFAFLRPNATNKKNTPKSQYFHPELYVSKALGSFVVSMARNFQGLYIAHIGTSLDDIGCRILDSF